MGAKEKEDMRGKTLERRGILAGRIIFILVYCIRDIFFFWGGGRLEDCIMGFGWRSLWKDCYKGVPIAESLGLGGQESLRNPGAREPERLCS
jgi:hypothetical protein